MRAFVILCCVATAYAASLGYDYNGPSSSDGGTSGGPSGFGGSAGSPGGAGGAGGPSYGGQGASSPSYGGQGASSPSYGGQGASSPSYGGQGVSSPSYGGQGASSPSYSGPAAAGPAEFTKEFFTYTAPEHEFDDGAGNNQLADSLKKSLRVIFIKGPESSGLENAALQLAKSAGDDRTAIYVLNKQADIGDLANKLQQLNQNNGNKPEVHFVKYRTPADAENAQRAIQSQYNNLGGHSSSHNGGVAPVLDFASKAPASYGGGVPHGGGASHGGTQGGTVDNAYLPPNRRF